MILLPEDSDDCVDESELIDQKVMALKDVGPLPEELKVFGPPSRDEWVRETQAHLLTIHRAWNWILFGSKKDVYTVLKSWPTEKSVELLDGIESAHAFFAKWSFALEKAHERAKCMAASIDEERAASKAQS